MKRNLLYLSIIVIAAVVLGSISSRATSFDTFDADTAVGGASLALKRYFAANPDAAVTLTDMLAPLKENVEDYRAESGQDVPEEDVETIYDSRVIGVCCVESSLNVRASATMLSEIVGKEYRGMEVYITGEKTVNGILWYKCSIDGIEGYMMGKYLVFGDEAEEFKQVVHNEYRDNTALPTEVTFADDINGLSDDVKNALNSYKQNIDYALANDYPAQESAGSYLGMYTVLIYILENYNSISDICDQYGLSDTSSLIRNQIWTVELRRERLSYQSDTTYDEFEQQMEEEAERKAEEARQAAEAAERAYKESMVYQIPNYAAQFVGVLPYVWGGASLSSGADCSGFVSQIYAHFGLISQSAANTHAYDSTTLRSLGTEVSIENIQPGDLVCYNGHVAIYYGNGTVIHAPRPGYTVSFGSLYMKDIITIRRLY